MVNFKASSHQGEHKRALASQVGKEHQHDNSITKGEKSALLARPWSQTDPLRREVVNKHGIALQVAAREKLGLPASTSAKCALVDQQTFDRLNAASAAVGCGDSSAFLCRPGGDFVLRAVAHAAAEADSLLVDEAQRLSLHVCEGEVYEWVPFDAAKAVELADVSIEVQLLDPLTDGQAPLQVDCGSFGLLVSKLLFGSIVADNELFIIPYGGANLVLRVSEVVSVAAAEASEAEDACDVSAAGYRAGATDGAEADSDVRDRADAALNNHCFRGRVIATTHIHILPSTTYKGSASQRAVSEGLRLVGGVVREARLRRNLVSVRTSDGEVFPVSRRLLRPCIALTQAIRSTHAQPSVTVSVDCLTFDRVLCFLEAAALGTAQDYAFDVATLDQMGEAADALGLRLLQVEMPILGMAMPPPPASPRLPNALTEGLDMLLTPSIIRRGDFRSA